MTLPLPLDIGFGTVYGRFGRSVLASNDVDGKPDFVPFVGLQVTFTASVGYIIDTFTDSSNNPSTILLEPVVCTIDPATGYLLDPRGANGVNLIATDNAAIQPHGDWTYNVGYSGTASAAKLISHNITVPVNSSRWLANIGPVPSSTGLSLTQAQLAEGRVLLVETEIQALAVQLRPLATAVSDAAGSATAAAASATAGALSQTAANVSAAAASTSASAADISAQSAAANAATAVTKALSVTTAMNTAMISADTAVAAAGSATISAASAGDSAISVENTETLAAGYAHSAASASGTAYDASAAAAGYATAAAVSASNSQANAGLLAVGGVIYYEDPWNHGLFAIPSSTSIVPDFDTLGLYLLVQAYLPDPLYPGLYVTPIGARTVPDPLYPGLYLMGV